MFGMKEILGWRLGAKWVLGLRQVRVMPSKYQTIFNTLLQSVCFFGVIKFNLRSMYVYY